MFRWSGPGLRGGDRCEASVLTVHEDFWRICRLFAVGPGRVRCAAAPRGPHPGTNNEARLVRSSQSGQGSSLVSRETNLYLSPPRLRLAALTPLPFPGFCVSVHWRRRKRSREVKRSRKGVARILDDSVDRAGEKIRV